MENLDRFKLHIESALDVLKAEQLKVKKRYDEIQEEYKNKDKDEEWVELTEGMAESGMMLEQMIKELEKSLDYNF